MTRYIYGFLFLQLLYLFSFSSVVDAKVVINEVLNNPTGNEDGAEWVELYNTENSPVTLYGCTLYLDDNPTTTQKVIFGDEAFIEKFKIVDGWNTSSLNNLGDTVKIDCGSDLDVVSYGNDPGSVVDNPGDGISFGRNPDGIGNFTTLASVTLGEPNSNPPTPTLLPAATSTPTSKPTSTPNPSATPRPSSTFTPSSTPKPTNSLVLAKNLTSAPTLTEDNGVENPGFVAGAEVTGRPDNKTINLDSNKSSKNKFPLAAIGLITGGVLLLGVSLFPIIRNLKKDNKINFNAD